MDDDDSGDRTLSRKELARKLRREAYLKAKEQRAKDPRHLALKEAAKQQRREAYRKAKERHKAKAVEQKKKEEDERLARRTEARVAAVAAPPLCRAFAPPA